MNMLYIHASEKTPARISLHFKPKAPWRGKGEEIYSQSLLCSATGLSRRRGLSLLFLSLPRAEEAPLLELRKESSSDQVQIIIEFIHSPCPSSASNPAAWKGAELLLAWGDGESGYFVKVLANIHLNEYDWGSRDRRVLFFLLLLVPWSAAFKPRGRFLKASLGEKGKQNLFSEQWWEVTVQSGKVLKD